VLSGDVIRAYATYSANGVACDTPIHTFNAPHMEEVQGESFQNFHFNNHRHQQQMMTQDNDMDVQAMMRTPIMRRPVREELSAEDHFWTQAAVEAEINTMQGAVR
jgi:hypothetical protein